MNKELHDIDNFFRDGLDGHLEYLPPAVWEGVSHDLDKKQALYYKNRYHRLKRIALFLIVLCFLGSMYLVYDRLSHQHGTITEKTEHRTTPSVEVEIQSKETTADTTFRRQEKIVQNGISSTSGDTTSDIATQPATTKPNGGSPDVTKSLNIFKKGTPTKNSFKITSFPTDTDKTKSRIFSEKEAPAKLAQPPQKPLSYTNLNQKIASVRPQIFSRQILPLPARDFNNLMFNLENVPAAYKTILPAAMASLSKAKSKSAHGFSLSAYVAPNISFEHLEDNNRLAGPGRNRHDAHRDEQKNTSLSGGLLLSYELNKQLSLQSGMSITSFSTSIAAKTIYAKADNNGHTRYELYCSSGYVYISPKGSAQLLIGDSAKTSGTTSNLTYVTIPALLTYRISAGRFSLLPGIGAGVNFLVSNRANTSLANVANSESASTSVSGLKATYVDGHVNLGVEYALNKKFSLAIRPNARLALTPINRETPVKSYQNFVSVETGVRIKL